MVEARGVEPLSENPFTRISTSVACYCGTVSELSPFPRESASKHADGFGRLWYIGQATAVTCRRSPLIDALMDQSQNNCVAVVTEAAGAVKQQPVQNYSCRLILKRAPFYGICASRLAYHASRSPSKPLRPLIIINTCGHACPQPRQLHVPSEVFSSVQYPQS